MHGRVKDVPNQGTLSAAGNPAHNGKDVEWNPNIYVLEVILHGTLDGDGIPPGVLFSLIRQPLAKEILKGKGLTIISKVIGHLPGKDNLSSIDSSPGAKVYEVIGRLNNLRVMFHHYNRVPYVPEAPEDCNESVGIAGMKADRRLVQDIHGAHQGASKRRHKVHPLAFSAGERIHGAAECEIPKAHVLNALKAVTDLLYGLAGYRLLSFSKRYAAKPLQELLHSH